MPDDSACCLIAHAARTRVRRCALPPGKDAVALARDLNHGVVMPGWNWTGWFVTIVDEHRKKVDEVPIADV
jgi:hypothetical protein